MENDNTSFTFLMKCVDRLALRIYTIPIGYKRGKDYFLPIISGVTREVYIEIFCGSCFKDTDRCNAAVNSTHSGNNSSFL